MEREKETVQAMLRLYCKYKRHAENGLCPECRELSAYALQRLNKCKFGEHKPVCSKCPVHCYKPGMREKMLEAMRYAGPRMILVHPLRALRHIWDGKRKAPGK